MTSNELKSRIKETEENIERISSASANTLKQIKDFKIVINQCKIRDEKIKFLENDDDRKEKTKQLFKEAPPYSIPAMEQQIKKWYKDIEKFNSNLENDERNI